MTEEHVKSKEDKENDKIISVIKSQLEDYPLKSYKDTYDSFSSALRRTGPYAAARECGVEELKSVLRLGLRMKAMFDGKQIHISVYKKGDKVVCSPILCVRFCRQYVKLTTGFDILIEIIYKSEVEFANQDLLYTAPHKAVPLLYKEPEPSVDKIHSCVVYRYDLDNEKVHCPAVYMANYIINRAGFKINGTTITPIPGVVRPNALWFDARTSTPITMFRKSAMSEYMKHMLLTESGPLEEEEVIQCKLGEAEVTGNPYKDTPISTTGQPT